MTRNSDFNNDSDCLHTFVEHHLNSSIAITVIVLNKSSSFIFVRRQRGNLSAYTHPYEPHCITRLCSSTPSSSAAGPQASQQPSPWAGSAAQQLC